MPTMRSRLLKQNLFWSVLAAALVGCTLPGFLATKGTIPPPGPDGAVDPARAPDFIAVAGREDVIAGYVAKAYVFPEPTTVVGWPGNPPKEAPPEPVYGDDLRTVVGFMVIGKGFVPLGTDPAAVPTFQVEQGPAVVPPASDQPASTLYVRNTSPRTAWVAVRSSAEQSGGVGFTGGLGVGCFSVRVDSQLVLLDRSPADAGARSVRVIFTATESAEARILWVDIAPTWAVVQGTGVPAWWSGPPQPC
jgi:hypothetical protein